MFKCGEQALRARKRATKELKVAVDGNYSAEIVASLTAIEDKCLINVQQLVQWCTIAKTTKNMLSSYGDENC
jgi:glycine cleavage system regulatory protein